VHFGPIPIPCRRLSILALGRIGPSAISSLPHLIGKAEKMMGRVRRICMSGHCSNHHNTNPATSFTSNSRGGSAFVADSCKASNLKALCRRIVLRSKSQRIGTTLKKITAEPRPRSWLTTKLKQLADYYLCELTLVR